MKEIIWFFGSSTAGKKTFIENILATPDSFRNKLGIGSSLIKANKESLEWVTKKNHSERLSLVEKIEEDLKNESDLALLVKGQSFDLKSGLLNKLSDRLPEIKQSIIFVYIDPREGLERLKAHRGWYTPDMNEEYVISEIAHQIPFLQALKASGIPLLCVDGGRDAHYQLIDFPPTQA